jgi:hypothetical protein
LGSQEKIVEETSDKTPKYQFEQYPAKFEETNTSKKPILSTKVTKRYKTVITQASTLPANFAGHYRVATWGCGTDCRGFAIINKHTGATYTLPGVDYIAGVPGNDEDRLQYKENSRLFIITGLLNDETEGKFYYLWEGERLKLISKSSVKKKSFSD